MAKNILICDDAAFMRMMIKDILTKNGYNVVGEAENGAVAVEKHKELNPDLTLMDITMPEMDFVVLPSSTVTSNGTSMIKLIFSLLCAAATFGLNASNCAGW